MFVRFANDACMYCALYHILYHTRPGGIRMLELENMRFINRIFFFIVWRRMMAQGCVLGSSFYPPLSLASFSCSSYPAAFFSSSSSSFCIIITYLYSRHPSIESKLSQYQMWSGARIGVGMESFYHFACRCDASLRFIQRKSRREKEKERSRKIIQKTVGVKKIPSIYFSF